MKDYAHHYRKKRQNRLRQACLNFTLWIVIIALGYLVYHHQAKLKHVKIHAKTTSHIKNTPVANHKPTLDFYTLLPQEKVPASPNPVNTQSTINPNSYYLQVATSTDSAASQSLAEKLGTEGYSAFVVANSPKQPQRYRVMVGPFSQLNSATLNKNLLESNNIQSLLIPPKTPKKKNTTAAT